MPTREERLKILKMVQEGKISADQAVQLMDAVDVSARGGSRAAQPAVQPVKKASRWFRVRVVDKLTGKTRVDIRLPIHVVTAGAKLGARFSPDVAGLSMDKVMEYVRSGATGRVMYEDNAEEGEWIEVFIE